MNSEKWLENLEDRSRHFKSCTKYWYQHSYTLNVALNFEEVNSDATFNYLGDLFLMVFKKWMK